MKVAIYAKCSNTEQFVDNQLDALRQYAAERGLEVVEEYYEYKSGWKDGAQLELIRLMDDAKRRQFDSVLLLNLNRLSQGGPAKVLTLVYRLISYDVGIISCQQPWLETNGPAKRLLHDLTGWVARFESELRSERTKAGLARAKARGKILGRPQGSTDKRTRSRRGYFARYSG